MLTSIRIGLDFSSERWDEIITVQVFPIPALSHQLNIYTAFDLAGRKTPSCRMGYVADTKIEGPRAKTIYPTSCSVEVLTDGHGPWIA